MYYSNYTSLLTLHTSVSAPLARLKACWPPFRQQRQRVVQELCSQKMMVMEEIYPATPLHDQLTAQAEKMAKQKGMTKEEFMDVEMDKRNKEIHR